MFRSSFANPVLLSLVIVVTMPALAQAQAPLGVWEGQLSRGDVPAPVRVTITENDGSLQASLDLPALLYAEEPAPVTPTDGGIALTLPFGLGAFDLMRRGEMLSGARGDFTLRLQPGAPAPYVHETASITIAGGAYVGELYTPTDLRRPRGAIVIAGGSSAAGARVGWNTRSWCDFFARRNMHCLVYARRPSIDDSGTASTLVQDAADLRAAVAMMAGRPNVDRARLGVLGSSRGAWIAAEAAAHDNTIRFLILGGVPATTPADQEVQSAIHRLRADDIADADIADAVAYMRLYFSVAHSGENFDRLAAAALRAQEAPWGEYIDQPRSLADLAWWRANGDYDAASAYRGLRIPVYGYWGGADPVTPPGFHRPLLQSLMADNPELETHVIPGGDHRGEVPAGFDEQHRWRWFGMAPGLLDGISDWLSAQRYSDPSRRRH